MNPHDVTSPHGENLSHQEMQFRDWLLARLLAFSVVAGMLLLLFWIPTAISRALYWQIVIFLGLYGFFLVLAFVKTWSPVVRISGFLLIALGSGLYILAQNGLVGAGRFWLLLVPLLATLLLGRRGLWLWSALALGGYALVAWGYAQGRLVPLQAQNPLDLGSWAIEAFVPITVILVLGLTISEYRKFLSKSIEELQSNADVAQKLRLQSQEEAQRARRQADRIDRVAMLSRNLARMRDRDGLLHRLVEELVSAFGLYQANVFLLDVRGEQLNLAAAAGAQGQALVDAGWSLAVGGESLPGRVAQLGTAETAIPAGDERFPLRRAEVALPLIFGGELLGVLGIYGSRKPFAEEDVRIFRVLSDQVSAALNILRLLEETSARAQELRTLYAQVAGTSWRSLLSSEGISHQVQVGESPAESIHLLATEMLRDGKPHVVGLPGGVGGWLLLTPLTWRETNLGYVAFTRQASGTLPGEQAAPWETEALLLATTAVERLAGAFDTVRLLRDSRRKALYQEQLAHVGDLIWSSFDVETILRHGVREIGTALDANEVVLALTSPAQQAGKPPGTGPLPPVESVEEDQ
ncbi:MAG: GAF domain-containing protein [Anaerolineae bacterium]|nr:GAF domain-containing protein [Anaerolineae bacterium]